MKNLKLYNLLLNEIKGNKSDCDPSTIKNSTANEYNNADMDPDLIYYEDNLAYYKCTKKVVSGGGGGGGGGSSDACVTGKKCPEDEGYSSLEFQEWVWTTHNKFTATGTQKSRLCGLTASPACKATSCVKSKAVDGSCGNGTKAVWADLKNDFIAFKNASLGSNNQQGGGSQQNNSQSVAIDPDLSELKMDMEVYRSVLDSFDFPTGWSSLDTLNPSTYLPRTLKIDLFAKIKEQIINLIEDNGRSSEFGTFIKMMEALTDAYNNDKYKSFFQTKVDPKGSDVFATFESYITEIETAANSMEAFNYDPLTDATEEEVRDGIFKYIPKTVYNVGDTNLKMSVYFYTKSTPMVDAEEDLIGELESQLDTTQTNTNEETCKDLLAVYYQIYQKTKVDANTLMSTKEKIQDCWCKGLYENLGKIGFKKLYDKELRQDRKELLKFLSLLPSVTMDKFKIPLNSSVCKNVRKFK